MIKSNSPINPKYGKFVGKTNLKRIEIPDDFDFGMTERQLKNLKNAIQLPGEKSTVFTDYSGKPGSTTMGTLDGKVAKMAPKSTIKRPFSTNAASVAESLIPFASNISNAFRKPAQPRMPNMIKPVSLGKPSNANELLDIDRSLIGLNKGADTALDSNTAAAVKAVNFATGLKAKGQSYESNRNQGIAIDNQQAQINASIDMANTSKLDQFGDAKVNAQIAAQRESSENVANAADKFVQLGAAKDAANLDMKKFGILSKIYENSGVTDRLIKQMLKKKSNEQITDEDYASVLGTSIKRFGGYIGGNVMRTPIRNRSRRLKKAY